MSRTPSTCPAEPQASTVPPQHSRSLSERSTPTPSFVTASINSSYNGPLQGGRRPAAGVTTVQKRRFRTQSSVVGHGARSPNNPPYSTTITTPAGINNGHAEVVRTRSTDGLKAGKSALGYAAENKASNGGENGSSSIAAVSSCNTSNNKAKPCSGGGGSAETGVVLPKISTGAPQKMTGGAVDAARIDLSASTPVASSSSLSSTKQPAPQHVIKKQNPSSLSRTTPLTKSSTKDTVSLGETPPASATTEKDAPHHTGSPQPAPPAVGKREASDLPIAVVNADTTAARRPSQVKAMSSASPPPPRELSSPSRRESLMSSSAPPATSLLLPPSKPTSAKKAEATTAVTLGPVRGPNYVNGGNSSENAGSKAVKLGTECATPTLSRRDSALPTTTTHRTPQTTSTVEGTPDSVTLPRVSSQPPVQRTTSQHSSGNSPGASEGTRLWSCADSASADMTRGTSPASQTLKPSTAGRAPRLQPHPPATPLQSVETVTAASTTTGKEEKERHSHASRHASQLKGTSVANKSSSTKSSAHDVPLPTIISLGTAPISLRNFGATCYLNSVVQCLLHTPGLLRALDKDRQRIIKDWEDKKGAAFDEPHRRSCAERHAPTTSALLDLGTAGPKPDTPTPQLLLSLKAACGECNEEFAGNGQNDAHEFLITLLGVIDQEVCRSKPEAYETMKDVEDECKRDAYARWTERLRRENNSTIYDFFGGVTGSTVQCATCFLISYRFEAQLDISLPMAYNSGPRAAAAPRSGANEGKNGKARPDEVVAVDLLLHDMFFSDRGEFLSGAMQVTCDRCKKLRDKTIWSTIEQWPPILVLHLKRFNNAGVKNESAVVFPYTFCPFGRVKYQLYGVCCHRGTASFGHYTSYVYTGGGDASTADLLLRSSTTLRDDERAAEDTGAGAFCSPPSGSFARSVDGNFGIGAECDLPRGKNVTQGRTHGGGGGNDRGSDGAGGNGEKWYFCNDECITTVTPSEVVSKTKEAYILFYRRVA